MYSIRNATEDAHVMIASAVAGVHPTMQFLFLQWIGEQWISEYDNYRLTYLLNTTIIPLRTTLYELTSQSRQYCTGPNLIWNGARPGGMETLMIPHVVVMSR